MPVVAVVLCAPGLALAPVPAPLSMPVDPGAGGDGVFGLLVPVPGRAGGEAPGGVVAPGGVAAPGGGALPVSLVCAFTALQVSRVAAHIESSIEDRVFRMKASSGWFVWVSNCRARPCRVEKSGLIR